MVDAMSGKKHVKLLTMEQMEELFRERNRSGEPPIEAVIVYSEDNWKEHYSLESRSYAVSSDNRAFQDGKFSNSMFGSSLDGSDIGVRLDLYNWEVDYIYIEETTE